MWGVGMAIEQTYIMLKPDAVERRLMGTIISRIENKNFKIVDAKLISLSQEIIQEHYSHLLDKPFFPELEAFMTSGPVLAMIVEGENAIAGMRALMGPTNVFEAAPGTIRGDFASDLTRNLIHGSDSEENAKIEIERFFRK